MSETFRLGDLGEAVVRLGLECIYREVKETPKDVKTQMRWGDFAVDARRLGASQIGFSNLVYEVKTERCHTGNFFFETVSNVHTGRAGWMVTSTADELFYLFWEDARGYRIPQFQSVKWLFDYSCRDFKEVDQRKHAQANLTRGRLVPVDWVMGLYVGATEFDFSALKAEVEGRALGAA